MYHYLGAPPGMSLLLSFSTQSKFTSERNYRFPTGVLYTALLKAITQQGKIGPLQLWLETRANRAGCYSLTGEEIELDGLMKAPLTGTTTDFTAENRDMILLQ